MALQPTAWIRMLRRGAGMSLIAALVVALAAAGLFSGCMGYAIGPQTLYPATIRTVYVPMFESDSFRRNLGERLTEAVCKQIENRSTIKVVADPNADSVLTGRIVGESKRISLNTLNGDPRESQISMRVEVVWTDRQGRALRQPWEAPLPQEVAFVEGTASLVPEVGQSVATSQQVAINRLAEQIVGMMEAPW